MDDREDREAGSRLRRKNEAALARVSNPSPLETIVGYEFRDRSLLAQAITHASYVNDKKSLEKSENEKLEFLVMPFSILLSAYSFSRNILTKTRGS